LKPDARFLDQPKHFWANVRTISQHVGYTVRRKGQILIPDTSQIVCAMSELNLGSLHLASATGELTPFGQALIDYFRFRADALNNDVERCLMNAEQAAKAFEDVLHRTKSRMPIVMNKQKGKKKKPAYLTTIVNMLIEENLGGSACNFDPRELTTFTHGDAPLRTLARRVDGAFPSAVNPIAVWEIKEYYHTTTFGSRVADGVYETLLDGLELEELRRSEGIDCKHYLIVDAHYTWWKCGRSYLCRMVDMLHMGYVDEVLFGTEVLVRLPELVREWVVLAEAKTAKST